MEIQEHVCGQCNQSWATEDEYLAHVCPASQHTPMEPENLGAEFALISQSALDRGQRRAQGQDPEQPQ